MRLIKKVFEQKEQEHGAVSVGGREVCKRNKRMMRSSFVRVRAILLCKSAVGDTPRVKEMIVAGTGLKR